MVGVDNGHISVLYDSDSIQRLAKCSKMGWWEKGKTIFVKKVNFANGELFSNRS